MERRKLGYLEAICAATCEAGHNTSTVVSTCEFNGPLDQETMVDAIAIMFDKHPLLHSVIKVEEGNWYLETSGQFNDLSIEFMSYKKGIEKIIDREMTNLFDISKSLWRIVILVDDRKRKEKNHSIILSTHHSICDGASACIFFNDLLKMYEKLEENPNFRAEELPFLECVEELLDTRKTFEEYLSEKKHITDFKFDHYPYEKSVPIEKRTTRAKYIDLPKEKLEQIVKVAKEHHVSINSLLNAAMLLAYADFTGKKVKIPTFNPISLRDRAIPKIGFEHFGVYVAFIQLNFTLDSKMNIFELAKAYKEQFDEEVETQVYKPNVSHMKSIELFEKLCDFQPSKGENYPNGLCLSNLTRYPLNPNLKQHKIKTIHFTSVRNAGDLVFVPHVVTLNETMFISIAWTSPCLSDESGERYCELLKKRLDFDHE